MDSKSLPEQHELKCDDTECELAEIDIVSDPTENEILQIKEEDELDLANSKQNDAKLDGTATSPTVNKQVRSRSDAAVDSALPESDGYQRKDGFSSNSLEKVDFTSLDDGVPDEDDVYKRFYFESDHLALKDNADYRLLLQTFVALEAQRKQAIQDYEKLIRMRKEALAEPVKFVEKLQNNEPLDVPARQHILKVPQINWETYSGAIEDFSQFGLIHQHNTRHSSGTAATFERANQRWEEQSTTSSGSVGEWLHESIRFTPSVDSSRYVRGKLATSDKPMTFNQPWTIEEQRKLERLLQVYPQEPVEAKRWSKIANALGNRTPKQVASRIQKYFIKLAKSGLPIPGREPNLNRVLPKQAQARGRNPQQQAVNFHNSTFFPSYKPRVYMDDDEKMEDASSDDDHADVSDDESIPVELRNTKEYKEILHLKRLKKKRAERLMLSKDTVEHIGYMCDVCGTNPIIGIRWHCLDCPCDRSTDLCSHCVGNEKDIGIHLSSHKMEAVDCIENDFVDGDYVKLGGETSKGYNYLDPNFLPAAT